MREERTVQSSLFDLFSQHEIGRELKAMSDWLGGEGEAVRLVAADLGIGQVKQTGRHGLSADAALRCALLKQYFQLSYEELAFLLSDSASLRGWGHRYPRTRKGRADPPCVCSDGVAKPGFGGRSVAASTRLVAKTLLGGHLGHCRMGYSFLSAPRLRGRPCNGDTCALEAFLVHTRSPDRDIGRFDRGSQAARLL